MDSWLKGCGSWFLKQPAAAAKMPHTDTIFSIMLKDMRQICGGHTQENFDRYYTRLFLKALDALQDTPASCQAGSVVFLEKVIIAAKLRRGVLLPAERPDSDYRLYDRVYTYALVSAMVVEHVAAQSDDSVDDVLKRVIPSDGLSWLQTPQVTQDGDLVWQDWHKYFNNPESSSLYAIVRRAQTKGQQPEGKPRKVTPESGEKKKPQAGHRFVAMIREGIASGELDYNKPGALIQVDSVGRTFLLTPLIFKWCQKRMEGDGENIKVITNQFKRLKIIDRRVDGTDMFRGRLSAGDKLSAGFVVPDESIFWQGEAPRGRFEIK